MDHWGSGPCARSLQQDPLVVCGSDIMLMILSRLDARSLASTLGVSRRWRSVASSDIIWSKKPRFRLRVFLIKGFRIWLLTSTRLLKLKDRIMKEDLWDHAWEFHFREDAPEYWRNLDPYWTGAEDAPMHRYFHPDGSQTADSSDQVWGGHESCYSIITSFLADGTIREHYVRINRWPQLHISRREDWGWEMSNRLYCYSSVPDAHMKGGTGPCLPIL
ncbi:putative F-box domain-containing protein [Helianthus annuus]|nr:putative F-box domain-containing protein [Helianthus annuus]